MASTRLVLPWPLLPMNAVAPGSRTTSTSAYERKSCRTRCEAYNGWRLLGGCVAPGRWPGLHRVPAELVAHRGDRLHRRAVVLAGHEAGVERGRDGRRGDGVVDARLHGPATLPRVVGVAADLGEPGVGVERGDHQVEQPRTD